MKVINPGMIKDTLYYCHPQSCPRNPQDGRFVLNGLMCGLQAMGLRFEVIITLLYKYTMEMTVKTDLRLHHVRNCLPEIWREEWDKNS